jgi:hypothetical protein
MEMAFHMTFMKPQDISNCLQIRGMLSGRFPTVSHAAWCAKFPLIVGMLLDSPSMVSHAVGQFPPSFVSKDLADAAAYLRLSADQGNSHARYSYGMTLQNGWGVPRTPVETAKYLKNSEDH